MKKLLVVAAIAAGLTLLGAGVASAKPITPADGELAQTHELADCGEVTVTVTNTTKYLFEWTVKNVGTGDTKSLVVDGRDADGPDTASVTLAVDEDTTFSYGNTAGAEQDWYLPFQTVVVTACPAEEEPPSSTTAPPTTTTTPPPLYRNCDDVRAAGKAPIRPGDPGWAEKFDRDNDGVGCEQTNPTVDAAANRGGGSDEEQEMLAATGTGGSALPWVAVGGVLLLAGGGSVLYLTRRRRS